MLILKAGDNILLILTARGVTLTTLELIITTFFLILRTGGKLLISFYINNDKSDKSDIFKFWKPKMISTFINF